MSMFNFNVPTHRQVEEAAAAVPKAKTLAEYLEAREHLFEVLCVALQAEIDFERAA